MPSPIDTAPMTLGGAAHRLELLAQPLTPEAFAEFGDVIDSTGHTPIQINDGMTERYHALARVDIGNAEGEALINLFHALPYTLPMRLLSMERHPLGSQAFIPLDNRAFLVVVAPRGEAINPQDVRAFIARGTQGVNYHAGVWHHSLIAPREAARFLVVDRGGPGHNCDVMPFSEGLTVVLDVAASEAKTQPLKAAVTAAA
ncbi:MAG: ureidoglycolate lyase [Burkholderiaceae bacterium]|nr:ureidoglycolate lyase [Burkholderiaceae bacterium]